MTNQVTNSTAKAIAADRSAQVVSTTTNLMQRIGGSSHSEIVAQLPKDLATKVPNIKSTEKLLEKMPGVIVALDMHIDDALKGASQLPTISSLLSTRGDVHLEQNRVS